MVVMPTTSSYLAVAARLPVARTHHHSRHTTNKYHHHLPAPRNEVYTCFPSSYYNNNCNY
jgi:hypothetical protein